ncbi:transporter, partial [Staphylococcus hominis]
MKVTQNENLKLAQRGAFLNLVIYIILSIAKYMTGY